MPDKPLTVLTYAASASLAAVALVYFFNPNFVIDGASNESSKAKRAGIVGLVNTANDCFTNSSLQALAGLGELRLFLIRELHRRKLSDPDLYSLLPEEDNGKSINRRKLLGLQNGDVTQALKTILDQLNERPLKKKTISARPFILTLERSFETRISREQQDAQELLQIIAERVCDEYHAGRAVRKRARKNIRRELSTTRTLLGSDILAEEVSTKPEKTGVLSDHNENDSEEEEETGFPLEGQTQSQIVCSYCGFIPKSAPVSFVMLTLSVPQKNTATLNECFDDHFKREIIDDYKCDKCRLDHVLGVYERERARTTLAADRRALEQKISKLRTALSTDPEKPPEDVPLPDIKTAPARRIERYVKITRFPKILVVHLSRSIFNPRSYSAKNLAKVSFPESLPLGGLVDRRNYKLLGMIAHKGTHNSGHYECFRRQHIYAPYSRPHVDPATGPYSSVYAPKDPLVSPQPSTSQTATTSPQQEEVGIDSASTVTSSSPSIVSSRASMASTRPSSASLGSRALSPNGLEAKSERVPAAIGALEEVASDDGTAKNLPESRRASITTTTAKAKAFVNDKKMRHKTDKRAGDRWWRISDDKIKECKTYEVLDMEREVYMLFYEMER